MDNNTNITNKSASTLEKAWKTAVAGSVKELEKINTVLTDIGKTASLTSEQIEELAKASFDTANKYGKSTLDYLTSIQNMMKKGFALDTSEQMAQLSLLGQTAGNMASDVSDAYIEATNAAYDYQESLEELEKVLDGQHNIITRNEIAMNDMAEATASAASVASHAGVEIGELSALIGTIAAQTKESGKIIGDALSDIFSNLQDTSDIKIIDTLNSLEITQTEFVNNSLKLKTPIQLLRELSAAYSALPQNSQIKIDVLANITQTGQTNVLDSALNGMGNGSYDTMLKQYQQSSGSALTAMEQYAGSMEAIMNQISNTMNQFIASMSQTPTDSTGGFLDFVNNSINNINGEFDRLEKTKKTYNGIKNLFTSSRNSDKPVNHRVSTINLPIFT